jgi:hypothetical protein
LKDFSLIQNGFVERFDIEQRSEWERTRWQTFILLQPSVKANSLRNPKDLICFPWEQPENVALMIENNLEVFDSLFPKNI